MSKKTVSMTVEELISPATASKVQSVIDDIEGVLGIFINTDIGAIKIDYDDTGTNSSEIANTIMDMGYTVTETNNS